MISRICPNLNRAPFSVSCNHTCATGSSHLRAVLNLANSSKAFVPGAYSRPDPRLPAIHRSLFARSAVFTAHTLPKGVRSRAFSSTMSSHGEARPKRRTSPISAIERPKKQLKQENGVPTPGDATPQNGSVYDIEAESKLPIINTVSAAGDSPEWQATIEKVIKSVVSIHFCQTCSFDTDLSTSSQATGFVVDAENGYILTNRHVVCAGPFWGYCVFDNHEEVGSRSYYAVASVC